MANRLIAIVSLITPKRRWAQFRMATMFVVVTVLCVWLAVVVNRASSQRNAVAALRALGTAHIEYDVDRLGIGDDSSLKQFLRNWLPRDYTDEVVKVMLLNLEDSHLLHLRKLPKLQSVRLIGGQVSGEGLACLKALHDLEDLALDRTDVTDAQARSNARDRCRAALFTPNDRTELCLAPGHQGHAGRRR
jgi:hypothetical protein